MFKRERVVPSFWEGVSIRKVHVNVVVVYTLVSSLLLSLLLSLPSHLSKQSFFSCLQIAKMNYTVLTTLVMAAAIGVLFREVLGPVAILLCLVLAVERLGR